jgi:glutamine synthetase
MSVIEYIWLGGNNELRSKIRVLNNMNTNSNLNSNDEQQLLLTDIPDWNYDGSSTGQASGNDSEIVIKPKAIFKNPFRMGHDYMVLCDTYLPNNDALNNNNRPIANTIFNKNMEQEPWFGLEQEYFLIHPETNMPLGYDKDGKQGQYYCSVGHENAIGRPIAEEHMDLCLYAGIKISGMNAEVAPGQWEFQVGPCNGIEAGDHLWTARYILQRLGEKHGVKINFEPKPLKGDWNGSGCHTNYSTKNMREGTDDKSGLEYIEEAIDKLSKKHDEHMTVYGSGNDERMTGEHETASYDTFTDGVANRGASVRRGYDTIKNKKGYFEDRRPSSNCDPYLVTSAIFKTTCLD